MDYEIGLNREWITSCGIVVNNNKQVRDVSSWRNFLWLPTMMPSRSPLTTQAFLGPILLIRSIGHSIWAPGRQHPMGKLPELIKIQKEKEHHTVRGTHLRQIQAWETLCPGLAPRPQSTVVNPLGLGWHPESSLGWADRLFLGTAGLHPYPGGTQ